MPHTNRLLITFSILFLTFAAPVLAQGTTRVSVNSQGVQANSISHAPTISADGRYVAFNSIATNLVPGDTGLLDVFVHDRVTGQTTRVSVDSAGVEGNDNSIEPSISDDGRFVAFKTLASNLVLGDTNGIRDLFVHDRVTGQTTRVNVNSAGEQANGVPPSCTISADGRVVAFSSDASNLVVGDTNSRTDVFVHDRFAPSLTKLGTCPGNVSLVVSGGSIGGNVWLVYGAAGFFIQPNPPCQGIELGIAQPNLGKVLVTQANGTARFTHFIPSGAVGITVQAVDIASCTATNTIVL